MKGTISRYFFLVLAYIATDLDNTTGLPAGLSLTVMSRNSERERWQGENTTVKEGNDVMITCTRNSTTTSSLKIRRLTGTKITGATGSSANLTFKRISCDQMGRYVCEDEEHNDNTTKDLGIFDCAPRPCSGKPTKIVHAGLHETATFSLCITAYPDLSKSALVNGTKVRAKRTDILEKWSWEFEQSDFCTYYVNVTVLDVDDNDYGLHVFAVSTSHKEQKKLFCNLMLKEPEPPTQKPPPTTPRNSSRPSSSNNNNNNNCSSGTTTTSSIPRALNAAVVTAAASTTTECSCDHQYDIVILVIVVGVVSFGVLIVAIVIFLYLMLKRRNLRRGNRYREPYFEDGSNVDQSMVGLSTATDIYHYVE